MASKLWRILDPLSRRRMIALAALAGLAAIAEAMVVALIEPLVEELATGSEGTASATGPLVVFGCALVLKNAVVITLSRFKNLRLFSIQEDVSERLLRIYIRGANPVARDLDAGQKTSFAVTEPLQLVLNGYLPAVTIIAESLAISAVMSVLFIARPIETVLLAVFLTIGIGLFSLATRHRIIGFGQRRKEADTQRLELLRSIIESRVEVSGMGVGPQVVEQYRRPNHDSARMTAQKSFLTETAKNFLEVLVIIVVAPLTILVSYVDGSDLLATLAMFGFAAYRAMPALNRVMVSTQSMKFGHSTVDTIDQIFAAEPPVEANDRVSRAPTPATGDPLLQIRFDGFVARNGKRILDGETICILPGEICVIWGPSGSGKSTILEALIDGAQGVEIAYRGQPLPSGLSEVPGHVGVTAQTPFVLPGTVSENLTLGTGRERPDVDRARALLDQDPSSVLDGNALPRRLQRAIHRHSVSGGQAQRLSLIRALDPMHDVILLDEPTSALDERTAAALIEQLCADRSHRAAVIVTHDARIKRLADIVVGLA